jgi:hypothetical protein
MRRGVKWESRRCAGRVGGFLVSFSVNIVDDLHEARSGGGFVFRWNEVGVMYRKVEDCGRLGARTFARLFGARATSSRGFSAAELGGPPTWTADDDSPILRSHEFRASSLRRQSHPIAHNERFPLPTARRATNYRIYTPQTITWASDITTVCTITRLLLPQTMYSHFK